MEVQKTSTRLDGRLPVGFYCLLVYHGLLVVIGLKYILDQVLVLETYGFSSETLCMILSSAVWTAALVYASVAMVMRQPQGFLVGMICHFLLWALAMYVFIQFSVLGFVEANFFLGGGVLGLAEFVALLGLISLPFILLSGGGFFYLRRLRKSLLS
jgi:hypothetical protein